MCCLMRIWLCIYYDIEKMKVYIIINIMVMCGFKIYFWGKGVWWIIVYLLGRVGVWSLFLVILVIYRGYLNSLYN